MSKPFYFYDHFCEKSIKYNIKITLPGAIIFTLISFKLRLSFDLRVTMHRDGSVRAMQGANGIPLERHFDK